MTRMMKRGWGIKDNEDLIQKINGKNSDYVNHVPLISPNTIYYTGPSRLRLLSIYMILRMLRVRPRSKLIDLLLSDRGLKVKTRDDIVGYDGDKPITGGISCIQASPSRISISRT